MKKTIFLIMILGFILLSCGQNEKNIEGKEAIKGNQTQNNEGTRNIQETQVVNNQNKPTTKRFGNETVGFIDYPEGWSLFKDPNSQPTALQITKNSRQIISLDKNITQGKDAATSVKLLYDGFINLGFKKENMSINRGKINNNPAYMLRLELESGIVGMFMFVDYKGKVFYVAVEGTPEEAMESLSMVNKSWNPER